MHVSIHASNRWIWLPQAEQDQQESAGDFQIIDAPLPAHDATHIRVQRDGDSLVIRVGGVDNLTHLPTRPDARETVELLFDRKHDHFGFEQYIFQAPTSGDAESVGPAEPRRNAEGEVAPHFEPRRSDDCITNWHHPYDEILLGDCAPMAEPHYRWRDADLTRCDITHDRYAELEVRFPLDTVFAHSQSVGFNVTRWRPGIAEFSAWNYLSGNGSPDAAGFGHLHRREPTALLEPAVRLTPDRLTLSGRLSGPAPACPLAMRIVSPLGQTVAESRLEWDADSWRLTAALPADAWNTAGRWLLYPIAADGSALEPDYFAMDVVDPAALAPFELGVTFDTPMCLVNAPYTPARLAAEMAQWRRHGIDRIHWLEYGDWPSFWQTPNHGWAANVPPTRDACGPNLLAAATQAAHDAGLKLVADLKTFDLGFNCWFQEPDGVSTAPALEGRDIVVAPELAAQPEATQQAHPGWLAQQPTAPIQCIRVYSDALIPPEAATAVQLLASTDNRRYEPVGGDWQATVQRLTRPAKRFTPAGVVDDAASPPRSWHCLEIRGLALDAPYMALCLDGADWSYANRGFLLLEGTGADGRTGMLTPATNGSVNDGFYFWKGWPGWNNHVEPLLQPRRFAAASLGFTSRIMPTLPSLLEPASTAAHRIWLDRIAPMLAAGVDGVCIRSYCHHNGVASYLPYMHHPDLIAAFRERAGREPEPTPADTIMLRRLRGDAYTAFIRRASALCRDSGVLFMALLESGAEIPDGMHMRMQLPCQVRTWLQEGLLDELRLKFFTAQSRYVHQQIMPLARQHGVPVSIISRPLHTGIGLRAAELGAATGDGARAAGFAGYTLYEQQNLQGLDPDGRPLFKGPVAAWLAAAQRRQD